MPGVCERPVWWMMRSEVLMGMLSRCYAGEDPELVYLEEYANSEVEDPDAEDR